MKGKVVSSFLECSGLKFLNRIGRAPWQEHGTHKLIVIPVSVLSANVIPEIMYITANAKNSVDKKGGIQ